MLPSFENILLPVDLSANTELAVKKTAELVNTTRSTIHLLHIYRREVKSGLPSAENLKDRNLIYAEKKEQMNAWSGIVRRLMPNAEVMPHLVEGGSLRDEIIQKAQETGSQLIVIATQAGKKWIRLKNPISPSDIARQTHSAVLTLKPGCFYNKIRAIVLPVRSFIPFHKVDTLIPLVYHKGITIYLVSVIDRGTNQQNYSSSSQALIETYRLLREEANCRIIHKLTKRDHLARTLLDLTKSVNADLLILNPDESKIWALNGSLDFSDLLNSRSKLQVLAVDRYEPKPERVRIYESSLF